ncbi:unnamed protein product [Ambrosiozyma monospora]|uniref:Unnamed protein product n=1 Tax=Ambrosiozyma monospora TaxID=43982 RepID=A0ACB5SWY1_AMBMO|nr:unnamed protein product [Ambrosiozyma monospora]
MNIDKQENGTTNNHDHNHDHDHHSQQQQQQPHTETTKAAASKKSKRACVHCNKKKVRCDLSLKNYPEEKCSRCAKAGIPCVLFNRKKRRTREEIEADRLRGSSDTKTHYQFKIILPPQQEQKQQQKQKQKRKQTSLSPPSFQQEQQQPFVKASSTPVRSTSDTVQFFDDDATVTKSRSPHKPPSPPKRNATQDNNNTNDDEIIQKVKKQQVNHEVNINKVDYSMNKLDNSNNLLIDAEEYLNRPLNPDKLKPFSRLNSRNWFDFDYSIKNDQPLIMKDLVSKETLTIVKITNCFELPNEKDCWEYIETYFSKHETVYSALSHRYFNSQFADLRHPPSLLLLLSILYIGSRISADSPEKMAVSKKLYHKARVLFDASLEPQPLFLVLSGFLLSLEPELNHSVSGFQERTRRVIKIAFSYDINLDPSHNVHLSLEEKILQKKLFWLLFSRDKLIAFSFAKDCLINGIYYNVPELTLDDFDESDGITRQHRLLLSQVCSQFQKVVQKVTNLQGKANKAFFAKEPFFHINKQVDDTIDELFKLLKKAFKSPGESIHSFISYMMSYALKVFAQRVSLYRVYYLIHRCVKLELGTPGILDNINLREDPELVNAFQGWELMFDATHEFVVLLTNNLEHFKPYLVFCQNAVFLSYQLMIYNITFLYSDDAKRRQVANEDWDKLMPVLEKNSDLITWDFADLCWTDVKQMYDDRRIGAEWFGKYVPFRNNALVVRSAYKIPKLRPYVERLMSPFPLLLQEDFSGDYHGLVTIPKNSPMEDDGSNISVGVQDRANTEININEHVHSNRNHRTDTDRGNDVFFGNHILYPPSSPAAPERPHTFNSLTPPMAVNHASATQHPSISSILNHSLLDKSDSQHLIQANRKANIFENGFDSIDPQDNSHNVVPDFDVASNNIFQHIGMTGAVDGFYDAFGYDYLHGGKTFFN